MPELVNFRWEKFAHLLAAGKPTAHAYKEAGFSPSYKNALLLAKKSEIIARVEEITRVELVKGALDTLKVSAEYEKLAFANMLDFIKINDNGQPELDFSNLTREQAAAIAEIIVEENTIGQGDNQRTTRKTKFKLHDKKAALDSLGRYLGMFIDRKEVRVGGVMFHITADDAAL